MLLLKGAHDICTWEQRCESVCVTGREAFIKEQMQKRLGKDADEAVASGSQLHPDDELYAVPSDLQVS